MIVSDLERSSVDPVLMEHTLGYHLPSGLFGLCNGLRERRQFHAVEIGLVAIDVSEMEEEFHFAPALPGENADTYRLFLLHVFPAQV